MQLFSILATPLGIAMKWLYMLLQNYGWTIIVFTFLVRLLMFPLTLKQQKSTSRMAAYQPMIAEIQKKWANDKNRQNQEVQKFYEENNVKMSGGCAPMLVNMLVLFGIIAVIQSPLTYILDVPQDQIQNGIAIVQQYDPQSDITSGNAGYTQQSKLIGHIRKNPDMFVTGADVPTVDGATYVLLDGEVMKDGNIYAKDGKLKHEDVKMAHVSLPKDMVDRVANFKFEFLGLNLANAPTMTFDRYLILPIISLLAQLGSQLIIMKTSPQTQSPSQMIMMTLLFTVMFGFYAFRVPVGFSLYYTMSSVAMTLQQLVVKRIHDPATIREEIEAEIEERRAAKKAKKKVVIASADGQQEDLEVSESELNKIRLAKARELDASRYGDDKKSANVDKASEQARKLDEEKYGAKATDSKETKKTAEEAQPETAEADTKDEEATDLVLDEAVEESATETNDEDTASKDYKPGRRKRAKQNKEKESSFVEEERAMEDKQKDNE